RRPGRLRDERDLAQEVPRPERVDALAVPDDLGGAVRDDDELLPARALLREGPPGFEVELVRERRDLRELALRALREQRDALHQLELRILSEHGFDSHRYHGHMSRRASDALIVDALRSPIGKKNGT